MSYVQHGFVIDHARNYVTWDDLSIPMIKDARTSTPTDDTVTHFTCSDHLHGIYTAGVTKIKQAKYDSIDPQMVASQCHHLSIPQQQQLGDLLKQFPLLFSGKLGRYNKSKFTLELKDPKTPPIFSKPYPIPQAHVPVFKAELNHLIDKGVLEHIPRSEWSFPTFIIPQKDGRVRWVSDFRKLNHLL